MLYLCPKGSNVMEKIILQCDGKNHFAAIVIVINLNVSIS